MEPPARPLQRQARADKLFAVCLFTSSGEKDTTAVIASHLSIIQDNSRLLVPFCICMCVCVCAVGVTAFVIHPVHACVWPFPRVFVCSCPGSSERLSPLAHCPLPKHSLYDRCVQLPMPRANDVDLLNFIFTLQLRERDLKRACTHTHSHPSPIAVMTLTFLFVMCVGNVYLQEGWGGEGGAITCR